MKIFIRIFKIKTNNCSIQLNRNRNSNSEDDDDEHEIVDLQLDF